MSRMQGRQVLGIIFLGLLAWLVYLGLDSNEDSGAYNRLLIRDTLQRYDKVRKTNLSNTFYPLLRELVEKRQRCYLGKRTYEERNSICRKEYILEIFNASRQNIKSAPKQGMFIRCIRECPVSFSLCKGGEPTGEGDCTDMEIRCIELCMDEFWRGGIFPDENDFTHRKRKE